MSDTDGPGPTDRGALPLPHTERWQPLRLGLVDLFLYDDEQFWFHDGRLLLRGNNGTGKSKVLALTLPYLLDGSSAARRVEPDADPKKRMEWNLLLGGHHASPERTGYTWVEFGRRDRDGTEYFTTLGIGLKAATGRGIVKTWFFVTSRRIGDLRLVDDQRTVLTQERLRDELAGVGQVFGRGEAGRYRRAVDEALFRLGEERYGALVDLLIQLRQPQLSKRPDEAALSNALTEALGPLDQAVVADVAESFRSLEEERDGIAQAKETLQSAEDFLRHYRAYAQVAARRHTTEVRTANSAYEHAGRQLREAEEELVSATAEVDRLVAAKAQAERRRTVLQGQDTVLRTSPEMRDAKRLTQAAEAATDAEGRAADAVAEAGRAEERLTQETADATAAVARHGDAAGAASQAEREAALRAVAAGLAADHASHLTDVTAAERAVSRRREQVGHVQRLGVAAARAEQAAANQRTALDRAEAEATVRAEAARTVGDVVETRVTTHRDEIDTFLSSLSVLALADRDDLVAATEGWARSQDGDAPARLAVDAAAAAARSRLGAERAAHEHARRQQEAELAAVRNEIAILEGGRDPEPPAVPGRDAAARDLARDTGAPLWRVIDFAAGLAEPERAGIEAALQSSGLLDAWLFADGTVTAAGEVVLGPAGPDAGPSSSLAAALVAAVGPDESVPDSAVTAVLRRIGLGEDSGAALWLAADGCWGAGPARGQWHKERAEYVGAGAREAHRREILAELRERAAALDAARDAIRQQLADLDRQADRVDAEQRGYPSGSERDLVRAHADLAAAVRERDRAQRDVEAARQQWEASDAVAREAAEEVAASAEELDLPTGATELAAVLTAIADYDKALLQVRHTIRARDEAAAARDLAVARAAGATAEAERRRTERDGAQTKAAHLRAVAEELRASVGATVAELQQRLEGIAAALVAADADIVARGQEHIAAVAGHARAETRLSELTERREERAAARVQTITALHGFVATGLLRVALPEVETPDPGPAAEWSVNAGVGLARVVEQHLDGVDESADAWGRVQDRVSRASTDLTSQMSRHGHTAFIEQHGSVLVARVRYLNDEVDIDRLAARLANDLADRQRLLTAREQEILENHLVNEVAGHLHELLLTAEQQIDQMNAELAARKTSTGMQLRMRWRQRPDGPAGLTEVRRLMTRSDATWTAEDRAAIGRFLQAQIAVVREADPTGSWAEHLEQALDYRQWHGFVVERWQNGQWRSASGPASGGEKVLAVSVPLFAAAAAHYNTAGRHAPRLILLDEAFAGVDDDSRAKSLGLLATFDLDVVMTSEREWGCYPQVPGLSIAQLSRVEGIEAIGVTRWRWDGQRRERLAEVAAEARASKVSQADDRVEVAGQEGLGF